MPWKQDMIRIPEIKRCPEQSEGEAFLAAYLHEVFVQVLHVVRGAVHLSITKKDI